MQTSLWFTCEHTPLVLITPAFSLTCSADANVCAGGILAEADAPVNSSNQDWPAGALLPERGLVKQWAWRALRAAREELHLAVESVMEDLEGLSTGYSAEESSLTRSGGGNGFFLRDVPRNSAVDNDDTDVEAILRVDDLVTPAPVRAEYEQEFLEPATLCTSDHGFEIIDFEKEACIISMR